MCVHPIYPAPWRKSKNAGWTPRTVSAVAAKIANTLAATAITARSVKSVLSAAATIRSAVTLLAAKWATTITVRNMVAVVVAVANAVKAAKARDVIINAAINAAIHPALAAVPAATLASHAKAGESTCGLMDLIPAPVNAPLPVLGNAVLNAVVAHVVDASVRNHLQIAAVNASVEIARMKNAAITAKTNSKARSIVIR